MAPGGAALHGGAAETVQDPVHQSAGASPEGGLHLLLLTLAASQFCDRRKCTHGAKSQNMLNTEMLNHT